MSRRKSTGISYIGSLKKTLVKKKGIMNNIIWLFILEALLYLFFLFALYIFKDEVHFNIRKWNASSLSTLIFVLSILFMSIIWFVYLIQVITGENMPNFDKNKYLISLVLLLFLQVLSTYLLARKMKAERDSSDKQSDA